MGGGQPKRKSKTDKGGKGGGKRDANKANTRNKAGPQSQIYPPPGTTGENDNCGDKHSDNHEDNDMHQEMPSQKKVRTETNR